MAFRFRFVFTLVVLAVAPLAGRADDVLFIGNSFTFGAMVPGLAEAGGVPKIVEAIAQAKGLNLTVESVTSPGKDWTWHLAQPATTQALNAKTWSWLVLQDYSTRPTRIGNVPKFLQDGATLSDLLAQHSPHAGIVLYETWARPAGKFYRTKDGQRLGDPAQMMADLHDAYAQLARKLAALNPARPVRVALVGTAFARCHAEFPAINLDASDGHHASQEGYYLGALVITETITGKSAVGAPSQFLNGVIKISADEATELQKVADEVCGQATSATAQGK